MNKIITVKMKKLIYTVAAMMCAVVLVACGGRSSSMVQKGNKSEMDTLSYSFGVNIGGGITFDMPDLKLAVHRTRWFVCRRY